MKNVKPANWSLCAISNPFPTEHTVYVLCLSKKTGQCTQTEWIRMINSCTNLFDEFVSAYRPTCLFMFAYSTLNLWTVHGYFAPPTVPLNIHQRRQHSINFVYPVGSLAKAEVFDQGFGGWIEGVFDQRVKTFKGRKPASNKSWDWSAQLSTGCNRFRQDTCTCDFSGWKLAFNRIY